jgi:branched-chain amino acid transport system permease protein
VQLVTQTIVNSLILFSFYALIALGLSLAFGVMGTANYAHGEFYMVGAYTVWLLYTVNHWPFLVTVVMAALIVGGIGVLAERFLFRRARGDVVTGLLMSIGLVYVLQVLVGQIWGVGKPKPVPSFINGTLHIAGASVSWQRVLVVPVAIVTIGALYYFLNRTKIGRSLRAVAMDGTAAALQGISVNRSGLLALGVASAMAGIAGAIMAPILPVTPTMGEYVIWTCFVIIILGGAGNLKGTIIAAAILAFLTTIVTTVSDSTIAEIAGSLFVLVVLSVRPQGLMGHAES